METKKQKLSAIKAELEKNCSSKGFVKNIDNVFFTFDQYACVLRDVVYYNSLLYELDFEVLSLDSKYFVGSQEHAESLKEAFGGTVKRSEFAAYYRNPRNLYIWEKAVDHTDNEIISFEDAAKVIFCIL